MEPLIHYAPYLGWVYPNETVIEWSVAIVVYPYITGLVAGAFTVSSLYQVFGFKRLKPVAHLALLMVETWFSFRPFIVAQARRRSGLPGTFYRVLTLGSYDLSEEALRCDRKWIFWLAIVGIPGAHGLHGYVGFIFGSLQSRH